MQAEIKLADPNEEYLTAERCAILEVANDKGDEAVSIARARVKPGTVTAWHRLSGVDERYLIVSGRGLVEIGDLEPVEVGAGDVVRIPAGTPQRIGNIGGVDLVFYAICSPRFRPTCYVSLE